MQSLSVQQTAQNLKLHNNIILVDCREMDEFEFCHIAGAIHLPLSKFENHFRQKLNPKETMYIYCHRGGRSKLMCELLMQRGYQDVTHITGGIEAWSLEIDHKIFRY